MSPRRQCTPVDGRRGRAFTATTAPRTRSTAAARSLERDRSAFIRLLLSLASASSMPQARAGGNRPNGQGGTPEGGGEGEPGWGDRGSAPAFENPRAGGGGCRPAKPPPDVVTT